MMMDSRRFGFDAFPEVAPPPSAFGGNNVMFASGDDGINIFKGGDGRSLLRMNEIGSTGGLGMKRRPFLSTSEELVMEDDYYDEQLLPEKKRRLTPEQVYLLEKSFKTENKLEPERKSELAKRLGLQPRQVAVWFQNRRARWKTKQLEHDFDSLKASYNSLLADHDSLRADNQLLRSEVLSLMDKLQAKDTNDPKQLPESATVTGLNTQDNQSPGSGGSVVVGEKGPQWVVEKSESYYSEPEESNYNTNYAGILHSSEDDGSDDGGGYFPQLEFADHAPIMLHHQQPPEEEEEEEEASIGWWVWS